MILGRRGSTLRYLPREARTVTLGYPNDRCETDPFQIATFHQMNARESHATHTKSLLEGSFPSVIAYRTRKRRSI